MIKPFTSYELSRALEWAILYSVQIRFSFISYFWIWSKADTQVLEYLLLIHWMRVNASETQAAREKPLSEFILNSARAPKERGVRENEIDSSNFPSILRSYFAV